MRQALLVESFHRYIFGAHSVSAGRVEEQVELKTASFFTATSVVARPW